MLRGAATVGMETLPLCDGSNNSRGVMRETALEKWNVLPATIAQ